MSKQTEALKLALEALEKMARLTGPQWALENNYVGHLEALTALREALAEQPAQQEPVAWMSDRAVGFKKTEFGATPTVPLYTTPQAQPAPEIAIADAYRAGVDSGIAAEREACARVCDDWAKTSYLSEAKSCAKIIRARGNA